jgi:hypothetical protein
MVPCSVNTLLLPVVMSVPGGSPAGHATPSPFIIHMLLVGCSYWYTDIAYALVPVLLINMHTTSMLDNTIAGKSPYRESRTMSDLFGRHIDRTLSFS